MPSLAAWMNGRAQDRLLILASMISLLSFGAVEADAQEQLATTRAQRRANLITEQLEGSSIVLGPYIGSGADSLLFEANVAPHFVAFRGRRFSAVLTPKVVLRMRTDTSYPVVSPSYMPRITAYWIAREPMSEDALGPLVVMARLSHHSNGQNGPFFRDDGTRNIETGSFSTNYVEFGLMQSGAKANSSSLTAEWHPSFLGIDEELKDRYSQFRLNYQLHAPIPKVPYNVVRATVLLGEHEGVNRMRDRLIVSYSQGHKLPFGDFSLLFSAYHGLDYYNMRFSRRATMLRVGFVRGPNDRDIGNVWGR